MQSKVLRRVPLEQLMDLKIDFSFKQMFGKEKNKAITIVFLNAILQKTGHQPIVDVAFENIELSGETENEKQSRLDVLVTTKEQKVMNIEIQFNNRFDMKKRTLYYWSRLFSQRLKRSEAYKELQPVIMINILNFDIFQKETEAFHTTFQLYEDVEKFSLTDVMEIHFIEMSKLIQAWYNKVLNPWDDVLARWLLLLGTVDRRSNRVYEDIYKELEGIAMKDPVLLQAFHSWQELSMTEAQLWEYEGRLKRLLDDEAAARERELALLERNEAVQEKELAIKELENVQKEVQEVKLQIQEAEAQKQKAEMQKQEAEMQKQEAEMQKQEAEMQLQEVKLQAQENEFKIVRNMLLKGFDDAMIVELTNATLAQVQKLRNELNSK